MSSQVASRSTLRSTRVMRPMRQCSLALEIRASTASLSATTPSKSASAYSRPSASPGNSRQKSRMTWGPEEPVASIAKSIWSAASRPLLRAPTLSEPRPGELGGESDHLDGRDRGLGPLVPRLRPRAVHRLLECVRGQDAERNRGAALHRHLEDALGDGARDVVEVRRAAADDRAEGDDGVEALARRETSAHRRKLP